MNTIRLDILGIILISFSIILYSLIPILKQERTKIREDVKLIWNNGGRMTLIILGIILVSFSIILYSLTPILKQERIKNVTSHFSDNVNGFTDSVLIVENAVDENVLLGIDYISDRDSALMICSRIMNSPGANYYISGVSIEYNNEKHDTDDSMLSLACHLPKHDTALVLGREYYDIFSRWKETKSFFADKTTKHGYFGCSQKYPIINSVCVPVSFPYYNNSSDIDFVVTAYCNAKSIARLVSLHNAYKRGKYFTISPDSIFIATPIESLRNKPAYPWLKEQYGDSLASKVMTCSDKDVEVYSNDDMTFFMEQFYHKQRIFLYAIPTGDLVSDLTKLINRLFLYCIISALIVLFANNKTVSKNIIKFLQNESDKKDMETAVKIQSTMLSKPYKNASVELYSVLVPAKLIGGDLYYYYQLNEMLYFCVGDVSGKGIPAAMFMSKTVSLFQYISQNNVEPGVIAEKLNEELVRGNETNMFVTMFIGVLNLKTGILRFCNAGHDEPLFWNGDRSDMPEYLHTSFNLPLGVDVGIPFQEGSLKLKAGSVFLLYTDGVTEAMNGKNKQYGENKLLKLFDSKCSETAETINDSLLDDIKTFVGNRSQSDDITILTLKIKHIDETARFSDDAESLTELKPFFEKISEGLIWDEEMSVNVRAAVDEATTNVVKHGFKGHAPDITPDITLHAYTSNDKLYFFLKDNGVPFNPLEYQSRDINEDIDILDLQIGGLGIPMIKLTFDDLRYERTDGYNIFTMIKTL